MSIVAVRSWAASRSPLTARSARGSNSPDSERYRCAVSGLGFRSRRADLQYFIVVVLTLIHMSANDAEPSVLQGLNIPRLAERATLVACGGVPPCSCFDRGSEK